LAIVAGIDEAGLGPVLGPLVVSAVAFTVPDRAGPLCMWSALSSAVCRGTSRRAGKIAIGDSKRLFTRSRRRPLEHLERGVLGMLAAAGRRPTSLCELLAAVAPRAGRDMRAYPWYVDGQTSLPACIDPTDVILAGNSLRSALAAAGIGLAGLRCEPVFVGQFNRHVAATDNKSTVLFDVTGRLLDWLWRRCPPGLLSIHVDRQGGRKRYLPALQRIFEACRFRVIDENERFSAYQIDGRRRKGRICFVTDAETRKLPVALASMASKYLRELFMKMLNEFWAERIPGLSATAGYYTDGRRFYEQISPCARSLGVDQRLIYRCR